jgi:Flp pilus assembly protein TadD
MLRGDLKAARAKFRQAIRHEPNIMITNNLEILNSGAHQPAS